MEESKEKEVKKDKSIWIILLIGILVIALCCCIVYIWKINNTVIEEEKANAKIENTNVALIEEEKEEKENTLEVSETESKKDENKPYALPVVTEKEKFTEDDKGYTSNKNKEILLNRYVKDEETGKTLFSITYAAFGNNKRKLKITNDTKNKVIFNKKLNKDVIDIVIALGDSEYFEAIVLYSDGTIGKIETNKLVDLKGYSNISRIQIVEWQVDKGDGYSTERLIAIDKDGNVSDVELLAE